MSFETAVLIFDDPLHLSTVERIVEGEMRWQTIGVAHGSLLLVAHSVETEGEEEMIRIISARAATPRERRIYAEAE